MRWSFTLLLTTGSLIILDRILGLIPSDFARTFFLGIPRVLAQYPIAALYILFYLSLLSFAGYVYQAHRTQTEHPPTKRSSRPRATPELVAGVALSSLTSIIFVFALAGANGNIPKQALLWLLFAIAAGLLMQLPARSTVADAVRIAVWPAGGLFVYTLALLILAYFVGGDFVVSGGKTQVDAKELAKYGAIGFGVALAAVPAIVAASIARDKIFSLVASAASLSPEVLERLKTNLSSMVAILVFIGAVVLGYGLRTE